MLHQLIGESKDLSLNVKKPILTEWRKSLDVINAIFNGKSGWINYELYGLVIRQNRAKVLGELTEAFVNLYKKEKGIATVM